MPEDLAELAEVRLLLVAVANARGGVTHGVHFENLIVTRRLPIAQRRINHAIRTGVDQLQEAGRITTVACQRTIEPVLHARRTRHAHRGRRHIQHDLDRFVLTVGIVALHQQGGLVRTLGQVARGVENELVVDSRTAQRAHGVGNAQPGDAASQLVAHKVLEQILPGASGVPLRTIVAGPEAHRPAAGHLPPHDLRSRFGAHIDIHVRIRAGQGEVIHK